jgi:predicted DNA-binding WGR domain protein
MEPTMQLCWKSIRPEENRYRYYSLTVDRDLWGELCLVRRWGRIWSGSREVYAWPETEAEVDRIVRETHLSRSRHGYRLIRGQ